MANQANLQATLAAIEANPRHWNQDMWHCDTSHCFAGFAEMVRLGRDVRQECHDAPGLDIGIRECGLIDMKATQEWLGLSHWQWECIVDVGNSLDDIREMVGGEWPEDTEDEDWEDD